MKGPHLGFPWSFLCPQESCFICLRCFQNDLNHEVAVGAERPGLELGLNACNAPQPSPQLAVGPQMADLRSLNLSFLISEMETVAIPISWGPRDNQVGEYT